jgi:mono/diheme cytochrome c family protein
MRFWTLLFTAALTLIGGVGASLAQDLENGRRLSERWCIECHDIGTPRTKPSRVISFPAIAEKPGISSEMIASFLLMPHATMPNMPLTRKDAQDIGTFIMKMRQ